MRREIHMLMVSGEGEKIERVIHKGRLVKSIIGYLHRTCDGHCRCEEKEVHE